MITLRTPNHFCQTIQNGMQRNVAIATILQSLRKGRDDACRLINTELFFDRHMQAHV